MRRLACPEFSVMPDWVQARTEVCAEPGIVRVRSVLPGGYPAYGKLFHRIYIDSTIRNRQLSWNDVTDPSRTEVELQVPRSPSLDALCDLTKGAKLVRGSPEGDFDGTWLRWSELCARLKLKYHADLNDSTFTRRFPDQSWPRYLVGPDDGTLDLDSCDALVILLGLHAERGPCTFFYSPFAVRKQIPLLFEGVLEDVLSAFDLDEMYGSPTYWWPSDRSWCVCSDPDLTFTLVAGSERLIQEIAGHPEMEAFPIDLDARVDSRADRANP